MAIMVTRIGALLVVTGAVMSFTPWVAMIAVGAPMMIMGASVLAVALERALDLAAPPLVADAAMEPITGSERVA